MTSKGRFAGAGELIAAPIIAIAANLVRPTLSDDAANQVAAFTEHRGAMIAGIALSAIAVGLLTGGIVWLSLQLARTCTETRPRRRSARSVRVAAAPAIVHVLGPAQSTAALHSIQSSAAVTGLEPLQLLGDLGIALLGIAAITAGAPRWAGIAIAIGAIGEGAGFGTGTKAVVIGAFALLFVGLIEVVRTLVASPGERTAANTVAGGVATAGGSFR